MSNALQLSHINYLKLRNTVWILRSSQAPLSDKELEDLRKWEAAVLEYESVHGVEFNG